MLATTASDYATTPMGGIWRSTNGGQTWSRSATGVPPAGPRCTDRPNAYGIAFERTTGRAVVGTDCGISISADNGVTWNHVVINAAVPPNAARHQNAVWSVATVGNKVYAAGRDGIGVSGDAGATWSSLWGPIRAQEGVIHGLAVSPFDVNYVFLVAREDGTGSGACPGTSLLNLLYVSNNGALSWTRLKDGDPCLSRPGFVRTAGAAASGATTDFDVYFGGGIQTWRRRYANGTPPTVREDWSRRTSDHADTADIAFSRDRKTPILLASDGGVHRSGAGGSWTLTGSGRGGFNALQITDATGQLVEGSAPHTDLYFATQDNSIWASRDDGRTWPTERCCEGFHVRTPYRADADSTRVVTGAKCGPCRSFLADSHLANLVQWPNPPDGDSDNSDADNQGVPFLVRRGTYVQVTRNDDTSPPTLRLMLTTDTATTWTARGALPAGIRGRPVISQAESPAPVLYFPIVRDGVAADGSPRLGLVRVSSLYGPGDVAVADADIGLESLGVFPTMFARYHVVGVNPANADHLIAADNGSGVMKSSHDGGRTWSTELPLTAQLTADDTFRFGIAGFTLPSAIAWQPDNACHALIGSRENGILRSLDGGRNWTKVEGSERITNLSSFFFESSSRVVVSSYGRGLWRLVLRAAPTVCQTRIISQAIPNPTLEIWEMTHPREPFNRPGSPPVCPRCTYVLVNWGEVTDLDVSEGKLRALGVSGGMVRHLDQQGREQSLPEVSVGMLNAQKQAPPPLDEIRRQHIPLRGLVLEDGTVRAFIAGTAQPDAGRAIAPSIRFSGSSMALEEGLVVAGGSVVVNGVGFSAGGSVTLVLNDRVIADRIDVNERGEFRREFAIQELVGEYALDVIQRTPMSFRVARASLKVVPAEREQK